MRQIPYLKLLTKQNKKVLCSFKRIKGTKIKIPSKLDIFPLLLGLIGFQTFLTYLTFLKNAIELLDVDTLYNTHFGQIKSYS